MAKDPAMLWYWNDWHSGTSLMSRFLKGCYMDLLHAQFNHGRLSLEEIKICLGSDFGPSWPALQKKFKQEEGLFFNERCEQEKKKREAYSESRRANRKTYDRTHEEDMIEHKENRNRNENKDAINPSFEKVHEVFLSCGGTKEMAQAFFNRSEGLGWMHKGSKIVNFKTLAENFITNWNENLKKNGTDKSNTKSAKHSKSTGANNLLESLRDDFNTALGRGG